eukprot:8620045-Karenia_brevis.AAC.1
MPSAMLSGLSRVIASSDGILAEGCAAPLAEGCAAPLAKGCAVSLAKGCTKKTKITKKLKVMS